MTNMKTWRWVFWLLVLVFIWLVVSQFTGLEKLLKVLEEGRWQWIAAAAVLQLIYYTIYSAIYKSSFDTVEVKSSLRELIPVTFASVFMYVAAPLGGTSGSLLFVDDARRRGELPGRAAAGTLLVLAADYSAFFVILILGLAYLSLAHSLKAYEIIGALILLAITGGMAAILALGLRRPDALHNLLEKTRGVINRFARKFGRPEAISAEWAQKTAQDFTGASLAISIHPERLLKTVAIAGAAHIVNLLSLWMVVLAFRQAASPGVLVAGYAMLILFWIVSITPQGVGVVEGVIPLVFVSLGVPANQALIITLAFRGLTFWIPFLIGFILLRRMRIFNPQAKPVSDTWSLRVVSWLTAVMGVVNILSALTPALQERIRVLRMFSPLTVAHGGRFTAALAGFALILLAGQLRRRKRTAWVFAVVILVVSAISHLVKGLDFEEAFFASVLAGWLVYLRPHFHAQSDPVSLRQGVRALAAALLFTVVYGALGFYLMDRQFKIQFSLYTALRQTILMFTQFYDPGLEPVTRLGRYFSASIYLIGLATLGYAAVMLVRPVLVRKISSAEERQRARGIVETHGMSPLAPLALLPDKTYFFSTGGSLINFSLENRVALCLGDPIGPPEDFTDSVAAFQSLCAHNDWLPAFIDVYPDYLEQYKKMGFQTLAIGREAIVDLAAFTLEGGSNKSIRTSYNKLQRLGYRAQVVEPPLTDDLLVELQEISDAWLTLVHGSEKRFWVGWFEEDYIRSNRVMILSDSAGSRMAFANILPEYGKNAVTIDLMRHRPEAEHGVMDFLFVSLFQWAQVNGFETFDLGLSALSMTGEAPEDPVLERALHYFYEHVSWFFNFKGLHHFKEKFHPVWEARYLVYPNLADLPAVTLAMIRADSGYIWRR
ncbi:MAG: lysylphosphatidylglycerol synthetase family protein [Anaerolineaceae bacterium]|nr:lysylphosphatidylglycerol synthetase family protein [Anaerolineaceae bacterium]